MDETTGLSAMDDDTQGAAEAEPRWVYQVVRRELPAKPGEGARYALDQWVRERDREPPVIESTTRQPSQRPLGPGPSFAPAGASGLKPSRGQLALLNPAVRRVNKLGLKCLARPRKYHIAQAQPFHGLYRLVRCVPSRTGESFAVHAVCTGPYCGGSERVFRPYLWIVSREALNGCNRCSQLTRRARERCERRVADAKGAAT